MYVYVVCNSSIARRRGCAKPRNFHKIFYLSCCSILFVAVNALKEHISENWFDTNRHHPFVPQLRVAFVLTGGGYRAQVTGKYNWLDKSTAQLIGWLIDWLTNSFYGQPITSWAVHCDASPGDVEDTICFWPSCCTCRIERRRRWCACSIYAEMVEIEIIVPQELLDFFQ